MKAWSRCIAVLMALSLAPQALRGEPIPPTVALATWQKSGGRETVNINLAGRLSPKQTTLVNSGFSTFSVLEIRTANKDGKVEKPNDEPLFKVSCTAKYDTWQERYDVARLNDNPQELIVKTFDQYAGLCLTAKISDSTLLASLAPNGGFVMATLLIDQISASTAGDIKQWLIRQQTGVMQGLFSHMLGELKLTERIDVLVRVPQHTTAEVEPTRQRLSRRDGLKR